MSRGQAFFWCCTGSQNSIDSTPCEARPRCRYLSQMQELTDQEPNQTKLDHDQELKTRSTLVHRQACHQYRPHPPVAPLFVRLLVHLRNNPRFMKQNSPASVAQPSNLHV